MPVGAGLTVYTKKELRCEGVYLSSFEFCFRNALWIFALHRFRSLRFRNVLWMLALRPLRKTMFFFTDGIRLMKTSSA